MKKSQVLAALALAFALGVVAPVASVVNSADTYAVDYDPARQASYCDIMNGVSAVRGVDAYKLYEKVYILMEAYDNDVDSVYYRADTPYTLSNTGYLKSKTLASVKSALSSAISTATGTPAASTTLAGLIEEAKNIEFSNVPKGSFAAYENLFNYMTTSDEDLAGKEAEFRGAIDRVSTFAGNENWTPAQLKKYVLGDPNYTDAAGQPWTRTTEYSGIAPVIAAYKNAVTYNAKVGEFVTALQGLVGFGNVTLTNADVNTAKDSADPLKALYELVHPASGTAKLNGYGYVKTYGVTSQTIDGVPAGYAYLIYLTNYGAEHAQLPNGGVNDTNRDMLDHIGNAYNAAVALVPGAAAQYRNFKALMAAYTGTCGTTSNDGSNNNDGTGDNQNTPSNGDNKAPNTGALANAEGSASTTVAMVAGIATALTAAGAGVVAYRNARRSTRK